MLCVELSCHVWIQVRFLHNPDKSEGFVAAALSSTLIRFFKKDEGDWGTEVSEILSGFFSLLTHVKIEVNSFHLDSRL